MWQFGEEWHDGLRPVTYWIIQKRDVVIVSCNSDGYCCTLSFNILFFNFKKWGISQLGSIFMCSRYLITFSTRCNRYTFHNYDSLWFWFITKKLYNWGRAQQDISCSKCVAVRPLQKITAKLYCYSYSGQSSCGE